MSRAPLAGALVLAAALLLTGCGSSPHADLERAVTKVTDAANAQDAATLRQAVRDLVSLVDRQEGTDIKVDEADRIRADAAKVLADADLLDAPVVPSPTPSSASPSPSPSPTPSPTPSPSPMPSRTPSPTPSPSDSPTPRPTPTRTKHPSPTRTTGTPSPTGSDGGQVSTSSTPTTTSPAPAGAHG